MLVYSGFQCFLICFTYSLTLLSPLCPHVPAPSVVIYANTVAQVLGVSISSAYELMHETGFPALRIGSRIVVPKEEFRRWVDAQTGGDT